MVVAHGVQGMYHFVLSYITLSIYYLLSTQNIMYTLIVMRFTF